eukprot:504067-Prymnesium_polylepis.1
MASTCASSIPSRGVFPTVPRGDDTRAGSGCRDDAPLLTDAWSPSAALHEAPRRRIASDSGDGG